MKAALIDVDGTLLASPRSSEALFIRHLLRQGILGPRQAAAAGWFMLRHGPRYGRHAFRKNKSYLAGLRLADIAVVAEDFADDRLKPIISGPLLRRIEEHRASGARIFLLTGTPAFLARPLARIVGADGFRAARYAVRDGVFLAAPPIEHPLGADKVAMAVSLCEEAGTTLAQAVAYADSIHDLPLLSKAGRPVAVQPDSRLRREALARGWEVMETADGDNSPMARSRATHA
jgi:HAD superfamily hydrolase (TIGR01490 family)